MGDFRKFVEVELEKGWFLADKQSDPDKTCSRFRSGYLPKVKNL